MRVVCIALWMRLTGIQDMSSKTKKQSAYKQEHGLLCDILYIIEEMLRLHNSARAGSRLVDFLM